MKKLFAALFIFATSFAAFADIAETNIKHLNVGGTADIESGAIITFKAGSKFVPQPAIAISGTSIDWSVSQAFAKTLSANTTFTFSNTVDDHPIDVAITNTAGNFTVTWPLTVIWVAGTQPTQTTGVKTDIWTFKKISGDIYGSVIQNYTDQTPTPSPTVSPSPTPSPSPSPSPTPSPTPSPSPTPAPFAPDDIAGIKLWLAADSLGLNDGDPVASWTDLSGTSNTATQTGSARPTFKENIANGGTLPVVRFDGVDDYMTFPNNPGTVSSTFAVVSLNVAPSSQIQFAIIVGAPTIWLSARLSTTNWGTFLNGSGALSSTEDLVSGTFNVLEVTTDTGSGTFIYRDGVQKATNADFCGAGSANEIGASNAASRWVNADIAEVIIYDTVLSSPNRVLVETYLADKYGL